MTFKRGNEFLAFYLRQGQASEELVKRALALLPERTPYRVREAWWSPRRKVVLVNLGHDASLPELSAMQRVRRDLWPSPLDEHRLQRAGSKALLAAGYTTEGDSRVLRGVRCERATMRCEDAGGIAAFALANCSADEDERLFLWSTRPGLRSIAWAQTSALFVAGTRPRLVHLLARDFAEPSFDREFVRESLTGWSLNDRTPFEGTSLVAVDALLSVGADGPSARPHPTPGTQPREKRFLRQQVHLYRAALRAAAQPLRKLPGFELRLSGGKDSRLVAALLHDLAVVPTTVCCHGRPQDAESLIAEQVARALGWTIRFDVPELAYRGSVLDTVRHNLALADGFFATEPRHVPYPAYAISGDAGPGLVLGHIELQKGGWARFRSEKRESMLEYCRQRATPMRDFVVPELTAARGASIDAYAEGLQVSHDADYGYWVNYRFRVCRWLVPHYLVHSYELLPIYPLVDEKVARVVSGAPIEHLVSDRLMFDTMCRLAPPLGTLPLHGTPYRFEAHRPRTVLPLAAPDLAQWPAPKPKRMNHQDALREACAHVRSGPLAAELRELITPAVWKVMENPTQQRVLESGFEQRRLSGFFWICYQASVLFADGLPDLKREPPPARMAEAAPS